MILFLASSLWCCFNFASEASLSFALKNISTAQAIERFNSQILTPQNTTIGQEITNHQVALSFNRQNGHILLRANNEEELITIRSLIQNYIDI
jgi:hypothetical protein